jgi:hypothetical protein
MISVGARVKLGPLPLERAIGSAVHPKLGTVQCRASSAFVLLGRRATAIATSPRTEISANVGSTASAKWCL